MRVTTTKKFDKQFKKQPQKIQKEFAKRIELFLVDIHSPILNTHKLSGKLQDLWSFNVSGDIRVVFDKSFGEIVVLEAIGSHSELYE
jgi:addiction module RelE/StbE family toxin